MLKADKERIVSELAEELGSADTLIVADYRGLTNKQLEALRDQLLGHGARFRIVKNTLTRRAAEQAGTKELLEMLEGPTAIAFVESAGDPAAVAKTLATTSKATNVLTLRGGVLEGKTLSGEQLGELATLPPVDVLRGQVVGVLIAPVTQLVALLSAPLQNLHGLIEARIKQLEEQGDTSGSAAEAAEPEDVPPVRAVSEETSAADESEGATEAPAEVEDTADEATESTDEADPAATPPDSASAESGDQEDSADPTTSEAAPAQTEEPAPEQTEETEEEED